MTQTVNELLVAQGGLRVPSGAVTGAQATADAAGNLAWAAPRVYVQPTAPSSPPSTYLWVQTQLNAANDYAIWIEDGT